MVFDRLAYLYKMAQVNLKEAISLLGSVSASRLLNLAKLTLSYCYTTITGKVWMWGVPAFAAIEPTTACNLRCPQCPSGLRSFTRDTGNLKVEAYKKFIHHISSNVMHLNLYFQGEPYLHPQFHDLVQLANEKKIYTMTSTNGHFLTLENCEKIIASGLKKLIISIDGTSQDVYEKYRISGKLNQVLEGIGRLQKTKRDKKSKYPITEMQMVVFKHNQHQVAEFKKIGKQLRVDKVVLKSAQVYDEEGIDLIPDNADLSRYTIEEGKLKIKSKLPNKCKKMWFSFVSTWDGFAVPCCFDKDAEHQMGNVFEENIVSIWANKKYTDFRKQLFSSRKSINICSNCSEGL